MKFEEIKTRLANTTKNLEKSSWCHPIHGWSLPAICEGQGHIVAVFDPKQVAANDQDIKDREFHLHAAKDIATLIAEIERLKRNETDDPIVKLNRIIDGNNEPMECGHHITEWCDICEKCMICHFESKS
jgi:hypothetical protein